jgi:hypothetical protein
MQITLILLISMTTAAFPTGKLGRFFKSDILFANLI